MVFTVGYTSCLRSYRVEACVWVAAHKASVQRRLEKRILDDPAVSQQEV